MFFLSDWGRVFVLWTSSYLDKLCPSNQLVKFNDHVINVCACSSLLFRTSDRVHLLTNIFNKFIKTELMSDLETHHQQRHRGPKRGRGAAPTPSSLSSSAGALRLSLNVCELVHKKSANHRTGTTWCHRCPGRQWHQAHKNKKTHRKTEINNDIIINSFWSEPDEDGWKRKIK